LPLLHLIRRVSVPALVALSASAAGAQIKTKTEVVPPKVVLRAPAPLAAPQGVTATFAATGVRVAWQGVAEAVQYLVLRAPDATTPGTTIITVAAGTLAYLDNATRAAATYQVIAVAIDGRRGASALVAYQPPVAARGVTEAAPLPVRIPPVAIRTSPIQVTGTGAVGGVAIRTNPIQVTGTDAIGGVAIRTAPITVTGTDAIGGVAIRTAPITVTGTGSIGGVEIKTAPLTVTGTGKP
jgi:hypothetical protein